MRKRTEWVWGSIVTATCCSLALHGAALAGERAKGVEIGPEGYGELLGETPPEIVSDEGDWLNVDEPLTLEGLRGKPVWLEFGFIKCGGCQFMKPLLKEWHERYKGKLVIIEANNGELDSYEATKEYYEEQGVEYAVLWDREGRTANAYGMRRYPAAYLIGKDGKVMWEGDPCKLTIYDQVQLIWKALGAKVEKRGEREPDQPQILRAVAQEESLALPCCEVREEDDRKSRARVLGARDQDDGEEPEVSIVDGDGNVLYEGPAEEMPAELAARIGLSDDYERFEDDAYPDGGGPAVTSLEGSVMPLVEHFNQRRDSKRFMALVSATCPACIHGARSVRDSILNAHPDGEFDVSIVWIDMLPGDNQQAVARSARLFDDPRVTQFYDADQRVGELISLSLLKEGAGPAWDIYLFFDEGVTWGATPARPGEWYHQLSGSRRADTELFRTGEGLVNQLRESARRWLGVAQAAPARASGPTIKRAKVEQELELLYVEGCPNHEALRERLTKALQDCQMTCRILEVDLAKLPESDRRRRFGSPTILFEGHDLFGCAPNASGALTCRLYVGDGCPTAREICDSVCKVVCDTQCTSACKATCCAGSEK